MTAKIYTLLTPQTIRFGAGCIETLGDELRKLGAKRVLVVTDAGVYSTGLVDPVLEQLAKIGTVPELFAEAEPEPTYPKLNAVAADLGKNSFDLIVAVGGGSSLDTAKGLSILLAHGGKGQDYIGPDKVPGPCLNTIMIPTTAGTGSEVTNIAIFGDPDKELKLGIVSPHILARVALVDPVFTYSCPPKLTAAAGIDALVHAIESYTSPKAGAYTDALALEAMRLIAGSLKTAVHDGSNKEARNKLSEGALLAGISFGNAGVAAVHALAYPLGARFHVPHGLANGVLLPYVMESNLSAALDKYALIAQVMTEKACALPRQEAAEQGLKAIQTLCAEIGIPHHLRELGVPEEALEGMAVATMEITRLLVNNPKNLTLDDVRAIWRSAW
ncbi:MAG: iron-containing alcohol dehydrogenase [Dethiobacter sp.]|jgi:alcohol dehydrogenase class IV|nr:iron-containing alcohol dehydrogenase [Dethiobacter sp.]